jgi:hypothetical protein
VCPEFENTPFPRENKQKSGDEKNAFVELAAGAFNGKQSGKQETSSTFAFFGFFAKMKKSRE